MRDSIGIEMLGTPVVVLVTEPFLSFAKITSLSAGLKSLPIISIPHPPAGLPSETINQTIGKIIDKIINALTQTEGADRAVESKKTIKKPKPGVIVISGKSNSNTLRKINQYFYRERWTDGFPIVPPTEEEVEWMLSGTDRNPNEVVALIPPANRREVKY